MKNTDRWAKSILAIPISFIPSLIVVYIVEAFFLIMEAIEVAGTDKAISYDLNWFRFDRTGWIALAISVFVGLLVFIGSKSNSVKTSFNSHVQKPVYFSDDYDIADKPTEEKVSENVWEKNEDDWFDAALEDYDVEDGINVEYQESEDDLD